MNNGKLISARNFVRETYTICDDEIVSAPEPEAVFPNKWPGKKLSEMFETGSFSDVAFIVVDKRGAVKRIPAHKMILASMSPVFHQMFYGELAESGDIRVADASAEAFTEFLQLFYKSEVKVTTENIAEVMRLIYKYDVSDFFKLVAEIAIKAASGKSVLNLRINYGIY